MLRRRREQKTHIGKALSLLVLTRYRRKGKIHSLTRKRISKEQIRSQSKQQLLRRKSQKEAALFVVVMIIGKVLAQTTNSSEKRKVSEHSC